MRGPPEALFSPAGFGPGGGGGQDRSTLLRPAVTTKTATSNEVASGDEQDVWLLDSNSNAVDVDLPAGLSVGFTITLVNVDNTNGCTVTAGAGATVDSGGLTTISADGAVTCICTAANTWRVVGALE